MDFPIIIIWVSPLLFWGIKGNSKFSFSYKFLMKFLSANRIDPDGKPRSAASHLELYYMPMSHKKGVRLKRIYNTNQDFKWERKMRLVLACEPTRVPKQFQGGGGGGYFQTLNGSYMKLHNLKSNLTELLTSNSNSRDSITCNSCLCSE